MKYLILGILYVGAMAFINTLLFPDITVHYPEKDIILTLMAMPGAFVFMDLMSKSQEGGK